MILKLLIYAGIPFALAAAFFICLAMLVPSSMEYVSPAGIG